MMRWGWRILAGGLIWRLLGPSPYPRFPAPQEHPFRVPGRSVFVGDHEFFVRELGLEDGPPLVLVHGWGDHSAVLWREVAPKLAGRFRVVMIDNRASGKSDRLRRRYEIADVADDVAGVMTALGIDRAAVAGYSMGGLASLELAHRHPGQVGDLVLAGTSAGLSRNRRERAVRAVAFWLARAFERISRGEVSSLRTRYLVKVGAVAPRYERWAWREHFDRDPELYWQAGLTMARFDARPWVGRIDHRTLVIVNTEDQLMWPRLQYELVSLLPDPEVVELVGARHEAPLTHAGEMVAAIDAFLG